MLLEFGKNKIGKVLLGGLLLFMTLITPALHAEQNKSEKVVEKENSFGISKKSEKMSKLIGHGIVKRLIYDKSFVLRRGDDLKVTIFPEDDYIMVPGNQGSYHLDKGSTPLTDSGHIRLTTIGKVYVADMTIAEAEATLLAVLKEYFVDPDVQIEVFKEENKEEKEKDLGHVILLGEIARPGQYAMPVDGKLSLMQAISMAGGFSPLANIKKITITRSLKDGSKEHLKANAEDVLQGKAEDIHLARDDIINIPESFF